jgi:hypothetical protein
MNAVVHKLVKQYFAVITKEIPFDNALFSQNSKNQE